MKEMEALQRSLWRARQNFSRDADLAKALAVALLTILIATLVIIRKARHTPPLRFDWVAPKEADPLWAGDILDKPGIHTLSTPRKRRVITCYSPASGAFLAAIPSLASFEVTSQIDKASRAAPQWAQTTFAQRREVMRSLLDWTIREMKSICQISARDSGKPILDAAFGEIFVTASKLEWLIKYGEEALKPERRPSNLMAAHKISEVCYEPLGVVAAIVSYNYPCHNLISPVIAALFAGNAIVVKPSELVAWSSRAYMAAIHSCLRAHGHDPDIVQVLIGAEKEAAETLTGDSRIQHLTFIGSEHVGRQVAARAGAVGTQVTLELGGKDPALLLPTTDLKTFTPHFMRATFQAAGQNCIGTERFIVHRSQYQAFIDAVNPLVAKLRVGDPLHASAADDPPDIGAMVTDARFDELEALVSEAVKGGARLMIGGKRLLHSRFPKGHYFQPTLLVDVTSDMAIAQTELFAPVMLVMAYETVDEAIEIANGTRFALGASVYGRDKKQCEYVTKRLRCGQVSVNDFGITYVNQALPFGGVGASGFGRFGGSEGLRALCSTKAVVRDRFHGIIQTSIPGPLQFPTSASSWPFVEGLGNLIWAGRYWKGLKMMLWP